MQRLVLLFLAVLAKFSFGNPLSTDEALASFRFESEDLRIELAAAEPEVVDPVALCFDRKGRLYVVESRGYPHPVRGELPKAKLGRIARLEDADGDGRFEKRTEFARGLTFPNGILPWKKGFFVTDAPDVLYLEDVDGDGIADKREVLTGFFTNSSSEQLRVASPVLGPDGWIYLTSGLTGGKVTSPKHPDRPPVEARKNDWRFHPETLMVESLPSTGQVGQAFDREGRRFVCDNRHPLRWAVFGQGALEKNPNLSGVSPMMDLAEAGLATPLFPLSPDTKTACRKLYLLLRIMLLYRGRLAPPPGEFLHLRTCPEPCPLPLGRGDKGEVVLQGFLRGSGISCLAGSMVSAGFRGQRSGRCSLPV